jgi:hypothetical protein
MTNLKNAPLGFSSRLAVRSSPLYIKSPYLKSHELAMRQCQQLDENGRSSRRTLADAVEVLRQPPAGFSGSDRAEVRTGPLSLPSGLASSLVCVIFEPSCTETGFVVSLPTSAQFLARPVGDNRRERFDISRLHGAWVDSGSRVFLEDGTQLSAVEIIPSRLPLQPSELDWRIVHHTIAIIGEYERCYRRLGHGLEPSLQEMAPDLRFLDCGTLQGLVLPPMKVLLWKIDNADPTLKKLSRQKLADTLRDFGMRIPVPRPRLRVQTP